MRHWRRLWPPHSTASPLMLACLILFSSRWNRQLRTGGEDGRTKGEWEEEAACNTRCTLTARVLGKTAWRHYHLCYLLYCLPPTIWAFCKSRSISNLPAFTLSVLHLYFIISTTRRPILPFCRRYRQHAATFRHHIAAVPRHRMTQPSRYTTVQHQRLCMPRSLLPRRAHRAGATAGACRRAVPPNLRARRGAAARTLLAPLYALLCVSRVARWRLRAVLPPLHGAHLRGYHTQRTHCHCTAPAMPSRALPCLTRTCLNILPPGRNIRILYTNTCLPSSSATTSYWPVPLWNMAVPTWTSFAIRRWQRPCGQPHSRRSPMPGLFRHSTRLRLVASP